MVGPGVPCGLCPPFPSSLMVCAVLFSLGPGDIDWRTCISVLAVSPVLEIFHLRGLARSQETRSLGSIQGQ